MRCLLDVLQKDTPLAVHQWTFAGFILPLLSSCAKEMHNEGSRSTWDGRHPILFGVSFDFSVVKVPQEFQRLPVVSHGRSSARSENLGSKHTQSITHLVREMRHSLRGNREILTASDGKSARLCYLSVGTNWGGRPPWGKIPCRRLLGTDSSMFYDSTSTSESVQGSIIPVREKTGMVSNQSVYI